MKTLEDYPESLRKGIRTIAERLGTDYETAHSAICLESVLWDLYPSDDIVVSRILESVERKQCGSV